LLISITAEAQSVKERYNYSEDKKKQILYYKLDIEEIENKMLKNNSLMADCKSEIKSYDEEILRITEFLSTIEGNMPDSISQYLLDESKLIEYGNKLEKLKNSFSQKIIWLYKHGSDFGLQVLFTSNSFNDFYIRLGYLQKISLSRKKDFEKINYYKYVIEEKKKLRNLSKGEQIKFISNKKEDKRTLLEKKILTEDRLEKLSTENESLKMEFILKSRKIDKIEKEIKIQNAVLIFDLKLIPDYSSDKFSELESRLIYPVNSNCISIDFDKTINPLTNNITYNNGIDFSISRNSEVRCIADGYVESITYIPSYGNVILILHSEEYRTIYAVIKDISVRTGQEVQAGEVIAKTSDNFTGQCFHFEIWKNSTPLDPKKWISE